MPAAPRSPASSPGQRPEPARPRSAGEVRDAAQPAGVRPAGARRAVDAPLALAELGWDAGWARLSLAAQAELAASGGPPPVPGRVVRLDRGRVLVVTADGPVHAGNVDGRATAGDWVLVVDDLLGPVLPRRTEIVRGAGRRAARGQVLAANVDIVLLVVALSSAPNLGRLDRLLTLAWDSGARPLVVLTKADLADSAASERDQVADEVAAAAPGAPVLLTSTVDGRGIDELRAQLAADGSAGRGSTAGDCTGRHTVALLGTSGAGKSSLVNALAGAQVLPVAVRDDGRGRHTTVARELVPVPGLCVLLDTPGLRGVQLWQATDGLERTFADIEELAHSCQFRDCGHHGEPGCAVAAAVVDGRLTARRLDSHAKLEREISWLESRYDARLRAEARQRWRTMAREQRHRGRR